ncbi:19238_t:CDS:1, partial [Racocetra persica]
PTASDIYDELWKWYQILNYSSEEDENKLTILKASLLAEAIIPI